MITLKALRQLYGNYGHVHEGQTFHVDSESDAESLEARGLACRVRERQAVVPTIESFQPTYDTKVIVAAKPGKNRDART